MNESLETLIEQYIQHWLETGKATAVQELCPGNPKLQADLKLLIESFHRVDEALSPSEDEKMQEPDPERLPEGLIFIEEIGRGAFGRVVKARDPTLNRIVAVKLVKRLTPRQSEGILAEVRFLAALNDPAIPVVFAVDTSRSAIITEYVEGFELLKVTPTLAFRQLAQIVLSLAKALGNAHEKGILHRDIKPGNIKLDTSLRPKLLDFGLAQYLDEPPHGWGTPAYAAPEQFVSGSQVDQRSDLYALGAVFYEMLCGTQPFGARDREALVTAIGQDPPELPKARRPEVPTGLQAIVLKCLEKDPNDRYPSASELEQDLNRYLDGREVMARPTYYTSGLEPKVCAHLDDIRSWQASGLIFEHEERELARTYQKLRKPLEDWIPHSRLLSFDQIVLYLGVVVLFFGSVCLFYAHHFLKITGGWLYPALMFGASCLVLGRVAFRLRDARAVSIAYDMAAIMVLPLLILTLFREWGWFSIMQGESLRLFPSGIFTNAQVQVTAILVFAMSCWRAWSTRTLALSSLAVAWGCLLHLTLLLNRGWVNWIFEEAYHRVALDLVPLWAVLAVNGRIQEQRNRLYLAKPSYLTASIFLVIILELMALNGKILAFAGLSSAVPAGAPEAFDSVFFDTMVTLVLNGVFIHMVARFLAHAASPLLRTQSSWLYRLTPFLVLEPLAILVARDLYGDFYHWLYLTASLAVLWLSGILQRKSFYYAGLGNTVLALYYITQHYLWLEQRFWPFTLILAGLILLALGYRLYHRK